MGADGVTRYTLVGGMDKHMADGEDDYTWLRRRLRDDDGADL